MTLRRAFYHIGIRAYGGFLYLAAAFSAKARAWVQGRQGWRKRWKALRQPGDRWVWMHCASLGEFEQGRNLIDAIRERHPQFKILVTFFSPSGYRVRHSYPKVHAVAYLPLDTVTNARFLVEALKPELVLWIKYELWLNTLRELQRRDIPVLLIAARMDAESSFLRGPLAPLYQQALEGMRHIFVQDQATRTRLQPLVGSHKLSVSADTRYDRVLANQQSFQRHFEIEDFIGQRLCVIGGSVWPPGEEWLHRAYQALREELDFCLILAPHEIEPSRIDRWEQRHPGEALRYSQLEQLQSSHRILWIDNVGMLAQLYHYADVAYVGGGWGSGLHNILEPAAFGCPVIFGPQHRRFPEAKEMIDQGAAFAIRTPEAGVALLNDLLHDEQRRNQLRQRNLDFVQQRAGATERILAWCYAQNLLPPQAGYNE